MSHGKGKREKRFCCQVQFSHSSMGRGVTCRADTCPSEGQRAMVLLPSCAEGQPPFPSPAPTGRHTGIMLFWIPEHIRHHPWWPPRLWRINLIPLNTKWQPQVPLGGTDTVPTGRSWKKPPHSSPQGQFEYLNMPQTDCPVSGCWCRMWHSCGSQSKAQFAIQWEASASMQVLNRERNTNTSKQQDTEVQIWAENAFENLTFYCHEST